MPVRRVRDGGGAKPGLRRVGTAAAADMALLLGTSALADTALAMPWEAIYTASTENDQHAGNLKSVVRSANGLGVFLNPGHSRKAAEKLIHAFTA
jgi:hypothetical protein